MRRKSPFHSLIVGGICGPASWKAISGASKYL